jgi:hypothetical protein
MQFDINLPAIRDDPNLTHALQFSAVGNTNSMVARTCEMGTTLAPLVTEFCTMYGDENLKNVQLSLIQFIFRA